MKTLSARALIVWAAVALAACTMQKTEAPPLSGPSELGLAVGLSAVPDVITQDGFSQSLITVETRDANGQAKPFVPVRVEITIGGIIADFGQLSTKSVVTGSDGKAQVIYTAPPPAGEAVDVFTIITIIATPIGTDYRNAVARQADIRLVPRGFVIPPNGTPIASFSFSPTAPTSFTPVNFDASSSRDDDGVIVSYDWRFGDGATGSGVRTSHAYTAPGQYEATLTVTDDRNSRASVTKTVTVSASPAPTADFSCSPANPAPRQEVTCNASASKAAPGRTIVAYDWDMGNGRTRTGVQVTTSYDPPGTYTITLTVTDDVGLKGTASKTIAVSATAPGALVADFVFSPTDPVAGVTAVQFDASASSPQASITSYEWNFGDGALGTGLRTSHTYAVAGTYNVTLVVRDANGNRATKTQSVTVK